MKCKVFNSTRTTLEDDINNWLKTGSYHITQIQQTENSVGYIVFTIIYEELKEIRKRKLDKLDKIKKSS